jgi:hypothetical protein
MMRTLIALLEWLAVRAGAGVGMAGVGSPAWQDETTADRAGRLVPTPQDGLEPEVGRTLSEYWALWLAVGLVLLIVGAGYMRRRWRARGHARGAGLTWRGPR